MLKPLLNDQNARDYDINVSFTFSSSAGSYSELRTGSLVPEASPGEAILNYPPGKVALIHNMPLWGSRQILVSSQGLKPYSAPLGSIQTPMESGAYISPLGTAVNFDLDTRIIQTVELVGNSQLNSFSSAGSSINIYVTLSNTASNLNSFTSNARINVLAVINGNASIPPFKSSGLIQVPVYINSIAVMSKFTAGASVNAFPFINGNGKLSSFTSTGQLQVTSFISVNGNANLSSFSTSGHIYYGVIPRITMSGNAKLPSFGFKNNSPVDIIALVTGFGYLKIPKFTSNAVINAQPRIAGDGKIPSFTTSSGYIHVTPTLEGKAKLSPFTSSSELPGNIVRLHYRYSSYEISYQREPRPIQYDESFVGAVFINDTRFDVDGNRLKSAEFYMNWDYDKTEMYETKSMNFWAVNPSTGTQIILKTLTDPFQYNTMPDSTYSLAVQLVTRKEYDVFLEIVYEDKLFNAYRAYQRQIEFIYHDDDFLNIAQENIINSGVGKQIHYYSVTDFGRIECREEESFRPSSSSRGFSAYNSYEFTRIECNEIDNLNNISSAKGYKASYVTIDLGRIQIGG